MTAKMRLNVQHFSIATTNALDLWVDQQILALGQLRQIDEANVKLTFGTAMRNPSRPFGDRVILELKITDRFANWLRDRVEIFGLMQCGAAKYCEGLAGLPEFDVSHVGDFREKPRTGSGGEPLVTLPEARPALLAVA